MDRLSYHSCALCPRMCLVNRRVQHGFCGCGDTVRAARAALHRWEEPCISGTNGSGAVFFSGCSMRCCYCQNYEISHKQRGIELTCQQLGDVFLKLQEQGAHNINLVTATHYLPGILDALDLVRDRLAIPVVYNCSGYERPEIIKHLEGYVDIFLPDFKYFSDHLAMKYSCAPDYFATAASAIRQMVLQTGPPVLEGGLMKRGVIIRHMVLPGQRKDSIRILGWIKENLPPRQYYLSLLSQYTPFYRSADDPQVNRRITTYEYQSVVEEAVRLNLTDGFMQKKSSAKEEYTPPFDLEGLTDYIT